MRKATVEITAQRYENYAFYSDGVSWKPKMGKTLTFEVTDFDLFDSELIESFCTYICQKLSDDHTRYEYVEHEVHFSEPTEVTEEFETFKSKRKKSLQKIG